MVSGGAVTGITLSGVASIAVNPGGGGTGYSSANPPLVMIGAPTGANPVQATATAVVNSSGVVTGIIITNPGNGYLALPNVMIAAPGGTGNTTATATATLDSSGSGYTATPGVTIAVPQDTATATATLNGSGSFTIAIANGGAGYATTPAVLLTGGGTGPNFVARNSDRQRRQRCRHRDQGQRRFGLHLGADRHDRHPHHGPRRLRASDPRPHRHQRRRPQYADAELPRGHDHQWQQRHELRQADPQRRGDLPRHLERQQHGLPHLHAPAQRQRNGHDQPRADGQRPERRHRRKHQYHHGPYRRDGLAGQPGAHVDPVE